MDIVQIIATIFLILCIVLPFFMKWYFGRVEFPEDIVRMMNREDAIVSSKRTYLTGFLVVALYGLGGALAFLSVWGLLQEGSMSFFRYIIPALMLIVFATLHFFSMKNCIVVLCPEGIIERSISGKMTTIMVDEILICTINYTGKGVPYLWIRGECKSITIRWGDSNYKKAVKMFKDYINEDGRT